MVRPCIYLELPIHGVAHLRLGQHAAHRFFHQTHRLPLANVFGAFLAQAALVAAVPAINLLQILATGQLDRCRVDDDDVVASVDERRIRSLCACPATAGLLPSPHGRAPAHPRRSHATAPRNSRRWPQTSASVPDPSALSRVTANPNNTCHLGDCQPGGRRLRRADCGGADRSRTRSARDRKIRSASALTES